MNKRLTFLLCLAAFIVLFPLSTLAVNQEGDYDYDVSNGEAVITHYYGSGGNVTIPSELGGYPVTSIGS